MRVLLVPSGSIAPINKLEGTTTLPRCERALELLETGKYDILVLSGGQCHAPEIETQPAATTMGEWFAKQDIKIPTVLEKMSCDTYQNIACISSETYETPKGVFECSKGTSFGEHEDS